MVTGHNKKLKHKHFRYETETLVSLSCQTDIGSMTGMIYNDDPDLFGVESKLVCASCMKTVSIKDENEEGTFNRRSMFVPINLNQADVGDIQAHLIQSSGTNKGTCPDCNSQSLKTEITAKSRKSRKPKYCIG